MPGLDDFDDYGSLDPPVKPSTCWRCVAVVYGVPALLLVAIGVAIGKIW